MKTKFSTSPTMENVTWTLEALPSEFTPEEWYGEDMPTELQERDPNNLWNWCLVIVTGSYQGLEECTSLGIESYASEDEFLQSNCHYDMKDIVLSQLKDAFDMEVYNNS